MADSPNAPQSSDKPSGTNRDAEPLNGEAQDRQDYLDLDSDRPSRMAGEPGEEIDLEEDDEFEAGGFPWLIVGGAIALLALTGGALWWQQSQAEGDRGALTAETDKPAVGVSVAPVRSATVTDTSDFVGTLRALNRVTFRAETEGRILRVLVRSGQPIRVGQPLFQIEPREQEAAFGGAQANIASDQAAVQAARAAVAQERAAVAAVESEVRALLRDRQAKIAEVKLAEQELGRVQGLVEEGVLAAQLLDRAASDRDRTVAELRAIEERIQGTQRERDGAKLREQEAIARLRQAEADLGRSRANAAVEAERLRETQVRSSLNGVIGDIPVKVGDFVTESDVLATGFENRLLELRLSVPVERAAQLRSGTPVQIGDSNQRVLGTGRVNFISPTTEGESQTVLVKVGVPNQNGQLRDGQFVSARVLWGQRQNQAVVPASAIARQGKEQFVYVVQRDGEGLVARKQVVELGRQQGDFVEVLSGLQPGMSVVSAGLQRLSDGDPIKLLDAPPPGAQQNTQPNLTPLPAPSVGTGGLAPASPTPASPTPGQTPASSS
ncbi:MAG: efflux RND transporter periplasmic adaptor subunit [Cyanobacteria bacterium P01_D01_bin.73]